MEERVVVVDDDAMSLRILKRIFDREGIEGQYLRSGRDLDAFLDANDLVVIMVKHQEIIDAMDKLKGKIILDCHNVCNLPNAYRL